MSPTDPPSGGNDRRLCRRKPARGRVRVTCYAGTLDLGPNLALALLDVSESGARLRTKTALAPGQQVCVALEAQGHLRPVKRLGKVTRCVPLDADSWQVGVAFDARIGYPDVFKMT